MFENLEQPPIDALHGVMQAFASDTRDGKLDLGVGVYRDENGVSPIMRSVRAAEERLAAESQTKAYLPLRGFPPFLDAMAGLLFPSGLPQDITAIQSVGGTGAISLALELARKIKPDLTVHIATPTWPNHFGICKRLGIQTCAFDYLDRQSGEPSFENFLAQIAAAVPGDFLILHGPCHNPTGRDFDPASVVKIVAGAERKGVKCLIDAAYYGLGNPLDPDLVWLRELLTMAPDTHLVMSGSKAFGLYRDRIGVLFINTANNKSRDLVLANLEVIARANYSMPAAHGAQIIASILLDEDLRADWERELDEMQARILSIRSAIANAAGDCEIFARIVHDKGIFSLLPLSEEQVNLLAQRDAIYMPRSARINLAGLSHAQIAPFVNSVLSAAQVSSS